MQFEQTILSQNLSYRQLFRSSHDLLGLVPAHAASYVFYIYTVYLTSQFKFYSYVNLY